MARKKAKLPRAGKFKPGDKVRVKHGINDADYPDMPLGGWAGTIAKVHDDGMYTVQWNGATLAAIHPVYKKRCEKDGLDFDVYYLGEDDLESDSGGPLRIEKPKRIVTRPLSVKDQDDRIRMVFGLTSDDPLPDVDDEPMAVYHKHLSKSLVFPFAAVHGEEFGHPERVKVIGLGDQDDEPIIDQIYGILCEARVDRQVVTLPLGEREDVQGKTNRQLVEATTVSSTGTPMHEATAISCEESSFQPAPQFGSLAAGGELQRIARAVALSCRESAF